MSIQNDMSIDEAIEKLSLYLHSDCYLDAPPNDVVRMAITALRELKRGYAERVRIFDDPYTGRLYTTCSFCQNRVSKRDRYCKHCGRIFMEDNP